MQYVWKNYVTFFRCLEILKLYMKIFQKNCAEKLTSFESKIFWTKGIFFFVNIKYFKRKDKTMLSQNLLEVAFNNSAIFISSRDFFSDF